MLRISKDLWNVDFAFKNYTWDDHHRDDGRVKEKPKELGKDGIDVVRYTLMNEPVPLTDDMLKPKYWQRPSTRLNFRR
jgi:hypothetical protein